MKCQASFEFMLILIIGITILIPTIAFVSFYQIYYRDAYKISAAQDTVDKLAEAAESIYLQGYPARITLSVYIPEGVTGYHVENRTILFKVRTFSGETHVYSTPNTNVTGSLPTTAGRHQIVIRNEKTYVKISEEV